MQAPEPVGNRLSRWGEGPLWHKDRLWYVDIEGHAIVRLDPASGGETVWPLGRRVGFLWPCRSGRWIVGGDHGLFFWEENAGTSTPLADPEADLPDNRFNDAGCSPEGRLFAGTISRVKKQGTAALYRLDPGPRCARVLEGLTNSNGIAWSAEGSRCFHIDTPTRTVRAFDYDPANGALSRPRVFIDTSLHCDASPDGMKADAEGHLWVAFCHGGRVIRFSGDRGEKMEELFFPVSETTSCAFGGPGGEDLFVTTGARAGEALGGRIFVVRGVGVRGQELPLVDDRWL